MRVIERDATPEAGTKKVAASLETASRSQRVPVRRVRRRASVGELLRRDALQRHGSERPALVAQSERRQSLDSRLQGLGDALGVLRTQRLGGNLDKGPRPARLQLAKRRERLLSRPLARARVHVDLPGLAGDGSRPADGRGERSQPGEPRERGHGGTGEGPPHEMRLIVMRLKRDSVSSDSVWMPSIFASSL